MCERVEKAYYENADMVNGFCEEYGRAIGYDISIKGVFENCIHLDEIDADDIYEKSALGKMVNKLSELDVDDENFSFGSLSKMPGTTVNTLFSAQSACKMFLDDIIKAARKSVPTNNELKKSSIAA